jgi:hypothetical protein
MNQKVSPAFKKFIEAGKNDSRVLGPLERFVLSRPRDTSRRTDVFHPSEMSKETWCWRATYFQLIGFPSPKSTTRHALSTENVFANGHDAHARWQNWFAQAGTLLGMWGCWHKDCKERVWGMPYPECPNGHGLLTIYKEVPLAHKELRFGGHADGWLVGYGNPLLLEIKTVGEGTFRWEAPELLIETDGNANKAFAKLVTPFQSHIMQAQIYLKLIELIGFSEPAPEEILFLYENKATNEAKEFVIPKSDFGITEKFDAVNMILECIANGKAPACNVRLHNCKSCEDYND